MDLAGQNIIVFDCEIKEEIDGKIVTWGTPEKMGVSVAVSFDYLTMDYNVYLDDNLPELYERINNADMVSGFYTLGFDIPLLNATRLFGPDGGELLKKPLRIDNHYDMLYWSRRATGWNDGQKFPSNMRLDNHLEAMFGIKKTQDGADAPKFWQRKELGKLISYCVADVTREKRLFEHIWNLGWVKTAQYGQKIIQSPREMLKGWQDARNQNQLP